MSYLAPVVEVGGTGGNAFDFNGTTNGATLKKISVWVGDKTVKAINVSLTDGQSRLFGQPAGNSTEFIFEDGEHFISLSLWPNIKADHLGAIQFKTNHSREFFVSLRNKDLKPEVPVDVASGICMGIEGRSGLDVDLLGFMFLNTVKSTVLTNVEYPTLPKMIPKVNAREIKTMTYQNNTTETQEYKIETSKKITQSSSWSVTGKLESMFSLKVNGGIPLLAEAKTGYELKIGVEGTYASETSEDKMELFSFPVKVPPGKSMDMNITAGEATIDLPFNGVVKITCYNGGVLQFKTSGTYKGVTYTGGNVVVNEAVKNLTVASKPLK